MNSKILLLTTAIFSSAQLLAEDTATSATSLFKEKFKLSIHTEFGLAHQTDSQETPEKFNNFTQFYLPTIGWNFKKDLSLTISSEFKYASIDKTATFPNRLRRGLITFTKSEVLTEKEDGVKMNLGFARRYFDRMTLPDTYGNNRFIATFGKTMGIATLSMPITYLHNDPKDTTTDPLDENWRHTLELTPDLSFKLSDNLTLSINDDFLITKPWNGNTLNSTTFAHESYGTVTYQLTDMFSLYGQYHYLHAEYFAKNTKDDSLGYLVGTGINVAKNTTVTLEMGSVFLASKDNKTIAKTWKQPDFTVYFDWAL
jgi:hypothetical protein